MNKKSLKRIVINTEAWQTRVAVLENNRLQDIFFDDQDGSALEKCFFKGKVAKVLPGIQTAFVEIGQPKAGFLHISEIDKNFALDKFMQANDVVTPKPGAKLPSRKNISMGDLFTKNDEVLVQVKKEPIYEKGAKLTTCYTLPGKYAVLMPNIPQIGISGKIDSRKERERLKELVLKILPEDMGCIIRTDALGKSEAEIKRDLMLQIDAWHNLQAGFKKAKVGEAVHEELPLSLRSLREHFDQETDEVMCDDKQTFEEVKQFVSRFAPEDVDKVKLFDNCNLFVQFNIDEQITELLNKKVKLKSGGSIIVESTESMTVIDVNTGSFVGKKNVEDTLLKANLEAAEEAVRQLRLRNIGGIIIIDFIDMAKQENRQKLSNHLQNILRKKDRFKSVTLNVSEFGLVQMTRKRSGKTLEHQISQTCDKCCGTGVIKSNASLSFEVLRKAKDFLLENENTKSIELAAAPAIFQFLSHELAGAVLNLEKQFQVKVYLAKHENLVSAKHQIKAK